MREQEGLSLYSLAHACCVFCQAESVDEYLSFSDDKVAACTFWLLDEMEHVN